MGEETFLSREAILGASDIQIETVNVPEWGGKVRVRGLNGSTRNEYEQSLIQQSGQSAKMNMKNATAKLVSLTVVDEEDHNLFEQSDVEALGKKSGAALNRVYEVAARLSGLSDADMEELTKN